MLDMNLLSDIHMGIFSLQLRPFMSCLRSLYQLQGHEDVFLQSPLEALLFYFHI